MKDHHLDRLIFLKTREIHSLTGNMITGGHDGWIWFWSTHIIGGLIAFFNGSRRAHGSQKKEKKSLTQ